MDESKVIEDEPEGVSRVEELEEQEALHYKVLAVQQARDFERRQHLRTITKLHEDNERLTSKNGELVDRLQKLEAVAEALRKARRNSGKGLMCSHKIEVTEDSWYCVCKMLDALEKP